MRASPIIEEPTTPPLLLRSNNPLHGAEATLQDAMDHSYRFCGAIYTNQYMNTVIGRLVVAGVFFFSDGGANGSEGVALEPLRPPSNLDASKSSGFV